MCLSTVYRNVKSQDTVAMRNVMRIECRDNLVILTDLMERTLEIPGKLLEADLVNGFVVVEEAQ